jgi:hypothetical protein
METGFAADRGCGALSRAISWPGAAGATARPAAVRQQSQENDRIMTQSPRLKTLEDRHAALEREIVSEDARPRPDSAELSRLKIEKLRLKEEIERLRREG